MAGKHDKLPAVWPAEAHTLAKHAILNRYLKAWFPILAKQSAAVGSQKREALFVDGFAGPGVYSSGEPGSPIIALRAVRDHAKLPLAFRFLFIELDAERFAILQQQVAKEDQLPSLNERRVETQQGDCDAILSAILDQHKRERIRFGPALAFLDQFGYGGVSMELIKKIMEFDQCEVFSYLDYHGMNRWIGDKTGEKASAFDRTFGGPEWRECIKLEEKSRRTRLLELYKDALRSKGGAKYVVSFLMTDSQRKPLYWLLFCTNHLRGLEEMKKAMWAVDETGEFRFSDADIGEQTTFLQGYNQDWLARYLGEHFREQILTVSDIREHVLTETAPYLYKDALAKLERNGAVSPIDPPAGRRKGTFSDLDQRLRFTAPRPKNKRLFD